MVNKHTILLLFIFSFTLYAQEEGSLQVERDGDHDIIQYYFSTALTFEEMKRMEQRAYEQVRILQKSKRTREEDFALLKNAQLLGFLYPSIDDEKVQEAIVEILSSVRDEFLSYCAKKQERLHNKNGICFFNARRSSCVSRRRLLSIYTDYFENSI